MFVLKRSYLEEATNGELKWNDEHIAFTIELPWKNNEKQISCIPEGDYTLIRRYSKKFNWHWMVMNVINRNFILIHPANDAIKELNGCIAPVSKITGKGKGDSSRIAMLKVLEYFSKYKVNGKINLSIISENTLLNL